MSSSGRILFRPIINVEELCRNAETECLMEGSMPVNDDEIAIDRMFADNNKIKAGDNVSLNNKKL